MRYGVVILLLLLATAVTAQQPANPRQQPGATITMFAPEQHDLYDGHYVLSANRIHMKTYPAIASRSTAGQM